MRLKINKMEHFHYRNIGQIGHFFMNFHYARYEKVKKSVPPNIKNEASDHLKRDAYLWYFYIRILVKEADGIGVLEEF